MFPLFRRDGQQPSNHRSASESTPSAENSPENLPPELFEPGDSDLRLVPEEGQQDLAESGERVEQEVVERPESESTLPAGADAEGASPDGVTQELSSEPYEAALPAQPWRRGRPRGRRLASPQEQAAPKRLAFTAEQRVLLLDTWQRSGLPAGDFSTLVGVSAHTLYKWKKLFQEHGPAGFTEQPRGARTGSRLPEVTRRTILMLKEQHPEWGCQRISDMLVRGPGLPASASAVGRVLKEAGYALIEEPTRPHPSKATRFERARPNQVWQTERFTFVLKRQTSWSLGNQSSRRFPENRPKSDTKSETSDMDSLVEVTRIQPASCNNRKSNAGHYRHGPVFARQGPLGSQTDSKAAPPTRASVGGIRNL